jgi:beta-galactosidase
VYLVVTGPVHIARHGTFVTTPDLAATLGSGFAAVAVQTDVANDGGTDATVTVAATITGPDGRPAGHGESPLSIAAGQTGRTSVTVNVTSPALWSVASPHLYSLRTDIRAAGAVVDSTATSFGIRYFSFDPDAGFSLNGQPMKLQGVDLHATEGAIGGAVVSDAIEHQMRLMQSMGVNALRTAHNPPAPQLVRICERLGILLMVEAFDCWRTGKVTFDYHLYFDQWSGYDIAEMVHASKNSPAVVLWSIGNETPDTGRSGGPAIAAKLIAAIKAIDTTRPVVMGSDRYRSVPSAGSPPDQILRMLDGLGVNYNTATSMDGLHAAYPGTFFFCSETSSEESSRGVYADPQLLNTGENYTPGKRATSSYDNNLASWTMSGEYELKKDRDRPFWQGGFLWSGQDYIGEPTPYDVFPVKTSFFGAVDSAGFPKDAYFLFQSQWTSAPMVHIVPMNWTDYSDGQPVEVWVYSNVATVELFLNGRSLGRKSFDQKQTTSGRAYLETTEPTGDDFNYPSGSYTSPNDSTGKLHLTWTVPFRAGRLEAVATRGGRPVARDAVATAGPAHRIALATTRRRLRADGTSLAFVTAAVTDRAGVLVPSASDQLSFTVSGPGRIAGTDNGQQENAGSYQAPSVPAFSGRALVIIQSSGRPGLVTVTATAPGLAPDSLTLHAEPARGRPGVPAAGQAAGGADRRRRPPAGRHRRRQLLRRAGHAARRDAGRRPHHGLVQLLREGGHRQPAPGERVQRGRLGDGVLAAAAVVRLRRRVLHHRRGTRAARFPRGVVLGRPPVRAGAGPGHRLGHRVQPADHAHVRRRDRGQHAEAGPDQSRPRHRGRLPEDRRTSGAQQRRQHRPARLTAPGTPARGPGPPPAIAPG